MNSFITWLENRKTKSSKDFVLSYFNLDKRNGLNQPLNSFNNRTLINLKNTDFYSKLSQSNKDNVDKVIEKDNSMISDLIDAME